MGNFMDMAGSHIELWNVHFPFDKCKHKATHFLEKKYRSYGVSIEMETFICFVFEYFKTHKEPGIPV